MTHSDPDNETIAQVAAHGPYTREDLDILGNPNRGQHAPVVFQADCHPEAGVVASYCRDCGNVTLQCGECRSPFLFVRVARRVKGFGYSETRH